MEGIRVVEMGQLIAIPAATKLLADMGAQVIRIESCSRLELYRATSLYENSADGDYWNRAANFYEQNRNKLGLTLDLSRPRGVETLKELIAVSDVFAENFTPRVMRNFGLEYSNLRRLKPDLIMVSSTGYGHTGPWSEFGAIGYSTEAASGLTHITGYKDGPPALPEIPYADYTAAEHTAFAVTAALLYRARTGVGQFIDVSHSETLSSTVPEALMDYAVNGRTFERMGNRHPEMAPHGCYPCRGNDRWIVMAIATDAEWTSLCHTLDASDWLLDSRFADAPSRRTHHDELDRLISEVTHLWDHYELMHQLQAAGVACGAVLDGRELLFDPHLRARSFYRTQIHDASTGMPPLPYAGAPFKMLETTESSVCPAPLMGEHNRDMLSGLLGMPESTLQTLESDGIIGYGPVSHLEPTIVPLEDQKRQGGILDYDPDFKGTVRKEFYPT